jgi:cystathionine beta-lyase/cystathionine gamma-synthase
MENGTADCLIEQARDNNSTVRAFLEHPDIAEFQELTRRNATLSQIFAGVEGFHTTQGFQTAEALAQAFTGELTGVEAETIEARLASAHAEYEEKIEAAGIDDEDLRELFSKVWIYSRLTHPVSGLLEDVLAKMEKTEAARVFSSGLAAIEAVIRQFVKPSSFEEPSSEGGQVEYVKGGRILVIGSIYGGTYAQMMDVCRETGRIFDHLPISEFVDLVNSGGKLPEDTDMVFIEGSNNPTLRMSPIAKIAEAAHAVDAKLVCDMTFTPLTVRAEDHGADITMHSMTKYVGGRSEDLGGFLAGSEDNMNALMDLHGGRRMVGGGVMSPRVAAEFLQNIRDLPERLVLASENAHAIHEIATSLGFDVKMVDDYLAYGTLRDNTIPDGISNGMIALRLGSQEKARAFVDAMNKKGVGLGAVSLGATTTYYCIPAETTHSEMPSAEQEKIGITPDLVRLSCGIETNIVDVVREILTELQDAESA